MAAIDDPTVLLKGGPQDGRVVTAAVGVTRLLLPSEAPGLLDVYEERGATAPAPDAETAEELAVFEFTGQEPANPDFPEVQHSH
ncbi:MAG: hypothetical protein ABR520_05735 [Mycobacteriales bacterium]|nr:hypothetical protein [Frankia sp.]